MTIPLNKDYDYVIVGAGLSGLTTAYELKKINPFCEILILERSGKAGGLTGDWQDLRLPGDKRFQSPMHMIFRTKYPNILRLINEINGILSPLYTGYNIISSNEVRHRLEMEDWGAKRLPPPFHGIGMFSKLKMPLLAKWDMFKLAMVSTYCAKSMIGGEPEPCLIPNTMSLESLQHILGVGKFTRDFIESVTPSIYNLHPWYTSAPRMAAVVAGTMTLSRDSLHYHVFGKNYNAAIIDGFVEILKSMGVDFSFWTEARRIDGSKDGSSVEAIWVKQFGPESENSKQYQCENCGAENHCTDRAFCARCGLETTLDKIQDGLISRPCSSNLWDKPKENAYIRIPCKNLVTAMYPHMIAKLIPIDSALRNHPYVRSCFSSRGNQTQLSIGRVYYKEPVTEGQMFITGTHNPTFCFNGCQSVYNNFGGDDLDHTGDVIDVLLDVGVIRDAHNHEYQKARILKDLQRVYPKADPKLVEHFSFANIYPDALYLSEQPAITGLHRFFNTHRTGAQNWYVCGCHSGLIGIGMESAVEGALSTVNCILEDQGSGDRIEILPYEIHPGSKMAAFFGKAILLWKTGFKSLRRMAEDHYSLDK